MVWARVNSPPYSPLVQPKVGRVVVPIKATPYGSGRLSITEGTPYVVSAFGSEYIVLQDAGGAQYYVGSKSEFRRLKKGEKEKYSQNLTRFSFGKGGGQFGNDPEVFVVDEKGEVIPAYVFLPDKASAKWRPYKPSYNISHCKTENDYYACARKVFWDGFQAEFTSPRHSCFGYGCDYVRYGLMDVLEAAREFDPKAQLSWKSVMDIPEDTLRSAPDDGVALGCSPSKNAYTDEANPILASLDPRELAFRFAGYHIHIAGDNKSEDANKRTISALDAIAGVASVALFDGMEDVRRRKYYGLAGEYRTPSHGLEWRVLSSCVLCHPAIFHLLSDLSRAAIEFSKSQFRKLWIAEPARVQEVINTLDVEEARKLLSENKSVLRALLRGPYDDNGADKAIVAMNKGVKNVLSTDMHEVWRVNKEWKDHSNNLSVSWGHVSQSIK